MEETFVPFRGIKNDIHNRLQCYKQDWSGGFKAGYRVVDICCSCLLFWELALSSIDLPVWPGNCLECLLQCSSCSKQSRELWKSSAYQKEKIPVYPSTCLHGGLLMACLLWFIRAFLVEEQKIVKKVLKIEKLK